MKKYLWIFTGIGVLVAALWAWNWYKRNTALKTPSARDKDDQAADVQSANRDRQSAQAVVSGIIPPKASWIRPNGALLDLNRLGGGVPDLITLPRFDPWN